MIHYIVTVILAKKLVIATDQRTKDQFKSPFLIMKIPLYTNNRKSHGKPGYPHWTVAPYRVYLLIINIKLKKLLINILIRSPSFPGVSWEDTHCIYNKYPDSHDIPSHYWILNGSCRVYL